jgi:hypothetical protein
MCDNNSHRELQNNERTRFETCSLCSYTEISKVFFASLHGCWNQQGLQVNKNCKANIKGNNGIWGIAAIM